MMNKRRQRKHIVEVVLILGAFFALANLGLAGRSLYNAATQERSTYSIVAVDPVTGDVGIAGASCVPISAGAMATLVPGKGAAATQAAFTPWNQAKVFDLLRQGATASEIIEFVSDDSYDADVEIRQYGVVTLNEGIIQVAGFTGKENNDWAGDQQDSTMAVSVQGNTLEGAAVVSNALVAYTAEGIGAVELPDRLLRALEAASAAGGDRRCNQADVQQTAQAAFVAVAKADQLPFAATIGRDPAPDDPALPWLYISVIEWKGGPNPLLELRSQYNTWRSENLPPCADCNLDPIRVPTGGDPKPLPKAILRIVSRVGLVGVGLGCLMGVALLVSLPVIIYFRRRKRHSSA
ncbi:MAG: DUF1028 domain-containing protein [Anaerolineae bacterium]